MEALDLSSAVIPLRCMLREPEGFPAGSYARKRVERGLVPPCSKDRCRMGDPICCGGLKLSVAGTSFRIRQMMGTGGRAVNGSRL